MADYKVVCPDCNRGQVIEDESVAIELANLHNQNTKCDNAKVTLHDP